VLLGIVTIVLLIVAAYSASDIAGGSEVVNGVQEGSAQERTEPVGPETASETPTTSVAPQISRERPPLDVAAVAETVPVRSSGDAADDAAIWVDVAEPLNSAIVATDKVGGLVVYGLDGSELHYYEDGRMNNVDLRQGFELGGESVALVAATDRDRDVIHLYSVDPVTRGLVSVSPGPIKTSLGLAGLCMYHSSVTDTFSVFVTDSSGAVEQWQLVVEGDDVTGERVRIIELASTVEGCVADDVNGYLYLAEEGQGIWRYPAEPGQSNGAVLIDEVVSQGGSHLVADIEGLTIFDAGGGGGYVIASSQGNDSFVIYDRQVPNDLLGTFDIVPRAVDGVTHTDGIDVTSANLGGPFGSGLFIAQDDSNGSENQNFKLVPWSPIADYLGSPPSVVSEVPDVASDVYVNSETGDDSNSGTLPGEPWETLDRATRVLVPGQTIHLGRGSLWSESLEIDVEANASAQIRVVPYGSGQDPIIEDQSTCVLVSGSYITVTGLLVQNCSWAGITISGDSNVVEGNYITGNAVGVYVKAGANLNTISRNTLVDNNVMSVLTEGGSDDSGAFGILVHGDNTDIGYNFISGSNAFSYDYGWDGAAIEIFGGRDNYIHHNHAADNDTFMELGESRSSGNTIAYNVVTSILETSVFLVTRGVESQRGPVTGTIADNNSVYLSGASSQGFVCHGGCTRDVFTLRNNIIEAQWKTGYADGPFNGDHNVFFIGQQQFDIGPNSITADPQWYDPENGDFRLESGSAAIDRGALLGYVTDITGATVPIDGDFDGLSTPDAGAREKRNGGAS
jgi:myo-inositol-hexaphosphate 3-phosphohydrolase